MKLTQDQKELVRKIKALPRDKGVLLMDSMRKLFETGVVSTTKHPLKTK